MGKQQSFFTKLLKQSKPAIEASFRAASYQAKNKKPRSDGKVVKGMISIVANTFFKDHKKGKGIIAALLS